MGRPRPPLRRRHAPSAPRCRADIEGTGAAAARGPVRQLANLVVAGQQWDVSHATITIDGQTATAAQLIDGRVSTVQGKTAASAAGTADTVASETRIAGPIASIDAIANPSDSTVGHLVVLGQSVRLVQSKAFATVAPAGLAVGDPVEVNALVTADGSVVATRIDRRAADLEYFVTGTVISHDDSAHQLVINALHVDYSNAAPQGFPSGAIQDGELVRVFGRLPSGSAVLGARAVEYRVATPPGQVGEQAFLNGYITRYASSADFDVDGVPITTAATTVIQPFDVLALNVPVIVCGMLIANGRVAAAQVTVQTDITGLLPAVAGTIQSVDIGTGVLTVLGATVTTDAATQVVDAQTGASRILALSDLQVGNPVWVWGTQLTGPPAELKATLIKRPDPSVQWVMSITDPKNFGPPTLNVNGTTIVLEQTTRYFGSCSSLANVIGVSQSPAWGPCTAAVFWPDYATWVGPAIPTVTVAGSVRPSDGAAVASAVVATWN